MESFVGHSSMVLLCPLLLFLLFGTELDTHTWPSWQVSTQCMFDLALHGGASLEVSRAAISG